MGGRRIGLVEKVVSVHDAVSHLKDGMTVMMGGFLGIGNPYRLIDAILERGLKDLTVIANDTATTGIGISRLVAERRLKKFIGSHIGTNPETGRQMNAGELEVILMPQGTLVECIRAAGVGLGGVLTPAGVGTPVEKGKQKIRLNDRDYLLELPIKADVALLRACRGDRFGNLVYRESARNFNPIMAMAADLVIAEVEELVEVGAIGPDEVITPGIFVDLVVQAPLGNGWRAAADA